MVWEHKKQREAKLTDEFKKRFVINIKGKEAITAEGLKVLAHEKGLKSINTQIIQFPNAENQGTTIVQATVIGYDYSPIEDKVVEVMYSAVGDASKITCSNMIAPHAIRMAETRAINRALKNYTNVGMVSSEELMEATSDDTHPKAGNSSRSTSNTRNIVQENIQRINNKPKNETQTVVYASSQQKNDIITLLKGQGAKNLDDALKTLGGMYKEMFSKSDIGKMLPNEADEILNKLKKAS